LPAVSTISSRSVGVKLRNCAMMRPLSIALTAAAWAMNSAR
jgi:hypothetical protein